MKQITISLLVVFCLSSPSFGGDASEPLPADKLAWFYTLVVQRESDQFSFSLMKDGWLAFDTWSEGKEMKEERVEITKDHYAKLKMKFENLFQHVQRTEIKNTDKQPSYVFERVSDSVTTLEFVGHYPKVEAFLDELSEISEKPLPSLVTRAKQ